MTRAYSRGSFAESITSHLVTYIILLMYMFMYIVCARGGEFARRCMLAGRGDHRKQLRRPEKA